jgi:hypothetical protein
MRWRRSRRNTRKGVSTIIGTLFFVIIVFSTIVFFIVMFDSFNNYATTVKAINQQQIANSETHISISNFTFGSSSGISSPGTTSASTSTSNSAERKILFSQGLWWIFYSNGISGSGRAILLQTSADGSSWSGTTSVTTTGSTSSGAGFGYDFSLWQSGSTVYYALVSGSSIYWNHGTMSSSGSISWTGESSTRTTNTVNEYDSIITDRQGNIWVAVNTVKGGTYYIEVWEYVSGTWNQADLVSSGVTTTTVPILLPTLNGVALIYGSGTTTGTVYITYTTDAAPTTWSSPISPPSNYAIGSSSATEIGNTIYFAGLASSSTGTSTGTVNFFTYTIGATSTSSETVLSSTVSGWQVAISQVSQTIQIFYGSGSNLYQLFSVNEGLSFSSPLSVSTSQNSLAGLTSVYSGEGVAWISGTSPFNLEFFALSATTLLNTSPFPVHFVSLYIQDSTNNALYHFDVSSSSPDVSGVFDYWAPSGETITVPESFGWTVNDAFTITVTTDQGILATYALTAPS